MKHTRFNRKPLSLSIFAAMTLAASVNAQTGANDEVEEVTVTGFKASLNTALNQKRENTAAVDSIVSEDIGKFPDSNLAESMQRIPGVALSRGDGGEGKNISVRGLGAEFTRVRINGMEGTSQTGSSDIYGAGNGGRSFDFNVFPTEIFSELTVRKTPSADVEEGSLGATVDLKAPKPLSLNDDLTMTGTLRGVFNEISESTDPRASFLIGKKFADDTFGVLASVAYSDRNIREVGYSAVNLLPAYVNGGFCSPMGYTGTQNPANNAAKGADANNCSTGNPRTGSLQAYQLLQSLTGVSGQPGGGVFFPRIPRYLNSEQDATRTGGTLTFEWQPTENTNISLDNLFSEYDVVRRDNYIDALSLARNANNNGQPMMSIKALEVDNNGSLIYGLFDGVDLRSESLVDRFTSTFQQTNLNVTHAFSDTFEVNGLIGRSESVFDNPERLTVNLDAIDTDNFAIDFRNRSNVPSLSYGIDLTDPTNFRYAAGLADGTVLGNWNTRRFERTTENTTAEINFSWQFMDEFELKFGAQSRESDFKTKAQIIAPAFTATRNLPAGVSVADFTRIVNGVNDKLGSGTMGDYLGVDHEQWKSAVGFNDFVWCGAECGAQSPEVTESINSVYVMTEFNFEDLSMPVRGDIGVRYVDTEQDSLGFVPTTAPAGSTYPTIAKPAKVNRTYDDLLPSTNVVVEINPSLQARFSFAEVMSRPELGLLIPSGSMNPTTRVASVGNPFLDPIRAKTYDAALEWYFDEGALASVAYFEKDISTYIQSISSMVPYTELGLPTTLLEGSAATPTDLFTVNRSTNTPGGPLKGYELNLQLPFTFLPDFWQNFGLLSNYTHVTSDINYVLQSANGVPTLTTTNDLIGLSKNAASATIYYENDLFSFRTTGSYRSGYLRAIPSGGNDSDVLGNHSTLFVDTSASYNLTDNVMLILEAQNLTDERNTLYIDSKRKDPLFETRIGRTFTLGVNAKF
ncbi:MAG TPA: TonB-dependent receptor [Cellvibrio sp.]|nr:TonB-dependent receptor [Cellvibrio sp.]